MGKPFKVGAATNAQRGGSRLISKNASKVIAHATDSDSDSLFDAVREDTPPDHEVGGVVGDSDDRHFIDANPWPPAEHYRGEPQPTPVTPRNPFKLK